jgi:hypothetical protein
MRDRKLLAFWKKFHDHPMPACSTGLAVTAAAERFTARVPMLQFIIDEIRP